MWDAESVRVERRCNELRRDAMRSKTDKMRGKVGGKRWEAGERQEARQEMKHALWTVGPQPQVLS